MTKSGDGINDAPSLGRAYVGISLSDGTQVAISSSQVVLLGGDITRLESAFKIAKRTISIIKQNLFWAFSYNVIAIPIAALGMLNPTISCLAMAFSDVVVIANSLRLKR